MVYVDTALALLPLGTLLGVAAKHPVSRWPILCRACYLLFWKQSKRQGQVTLGLPVGLQSFLLKITRSPVTNPCWLFTSPDSLQMLRGIQNAQPYVEFLRKLGIGLKPLFRCGLNGARKLFLLATGWKAFDLGSQQPPQLSEWPWNSVVLLSWLSELVSSDRVRLVTQHLSVRDMEPLFERLWVQKFSGMQFPLIQGLTLGCTSPRVLGAAVDPCTVLQVVLTLKLCRFPTYALMTIGTVGLFLTAKALWLQSLYPGS